MGIFLNIYYIFIGYIHYFIFPHALASSTEGNVWSNYILYTSLITRLKMTYDREVETDSSVHSNLSFCDFELYNYK